MKSVRVSENVVTNNRRGYFREAGQGEFREKTLGCTERRGKQEKM